MKITIQDSWLRPSGLYQCPYCGKEYSKKGIASHIHLQHTEKGAERIQAAKEHCPIQYRTEFIPWNKGLNKEVDERVRKTGEKYSERLKKGEVTHSFTGKHHTEESKQKISRNGKGKIGGYRKGSGRGKKGWYKGYWCDSSWELAFVIYNLEHGISFKRNDQKFEYQFEGQKRHWLPDFIMEDGTYVEIKGYETEQTLAKYAFFSNPLKIMKEQDLQLVFDYVIKQYSENFIELYE